MHLSISCVVRPEGPKLCAAHDTGGLGYVRSSLMVPAMDDNSYAFLNLIRILVAYSQSMHAHGFGPL